MPFFRQGGSGTRSREEQRATALGYIAETFARYDGWMDTGVLSSGEVAYVGIFLRQGEIITNLHVVILTAGAGLTLSKCGIYDTVGNRLASSANQGAAWQSSGLKTVALTSSYTVPSAGFYYLAMLVTGVTPPAMPTAQTNTASMGNALGANPAPVNLQAAQADLPAVAAFTPGGYILWIGTS